jgi:hypothetical protein
LSLIRRQLQNLFEDHAGRRLADPSAQTGRPFPATGSTAARKVTKIESVWQFVPRYSRRTRRVKQYTVIYDTVVEQDLALLVAEHFHTPAARDIAQASNRIDQVLSMNPECWGQAIRDNLRLLWVPPLEIMDVILEDDRQVIVVDVRFVADHV